MKVTKSAVVSPISANMQPRRMEERSDLLHPCVGYLVGTDATGSPLVQWNNCESLPARWLASIAHSALANARPSNREVLLVFANGDSTQPVIIGLLNDAAEKAVTLELTADAESDLNVDHRRIVIEAREEVTLKCGKGYIQLRKDGTIVIKGTRVLSRSSGTNRIKGAAVRIN